MLHPFFSAAFALLLLPPIPVSPLSGSVVVMPPLLVCFCHHFHELVLLREHCFFCWSSRCWRSVSCVVVINAACSLVLSSSDSRQLVYSIMVCWSEGDIWSVVMLLGGLDDALLNTVVSALRVRKAKLLALSYHPCKWHALY